jgi:hypothetical protein
LFKSQVKAWTNEEVFLKPSQSWMAAFSRWWLASGQTKSFCLKIKRGIISGAWKTKMNYPSQTVEESSFVWGGEWRYYHPTILRSSYKRVHNLDLRETYVQHAGTRSSKPNDKRSTTRITWLWPWYSHMIWWIRRKTEVYQNKS